MGSNSAFKGLRTTYSYQRDYEQSSWQYVASTDILALSKRTVTPASHIRGEVSHAVWRYFLRFAASSDFHFTIPPSAALFCYSATFCGDRIQQFSAGLCSEPVLSIPHPYTPLYVFNIIPSWRSDLFLPRAAIIIFCIHAPCHTHFVSVH